jgi:hypothetical protein
MVGRPYRENDPTRKQCPNRKRDKFARGLRSTSDLRHTEDCPPTTKLAFITDDIILSGGSHENKL